MIFFLVSVRCFTGRLSPTEGAGCCLTTTGPDPRQLQADQLTVTKPQLELASLFPAGLAAPSHTSKTLFSPPSTFDQCFIDRVHGLSVSKARTFLGL